MATTLSLIRELGPMLQLRWKTLHAATKTWCGRVTNAKNKIESPLTADPHEQSKPLLPHTHRKPSLELGVPLTGASLSFRAPWWPLWPLTHFSHLFARGRMFVAHTLGKCR